MKGPLLEFQKSVQKNTTEISDSEETLYCLPYRASRTGLRGLQQMTRRSVLGSGQKNWSWEGSSPKPPTPRERMLRILSHLNCPLAPEFLSQVLGATFHGNDLPGQWKECAMRGQEMQILLLALWSNWAPWASYSVPVSVTSPVKRSESHQPSFMEWW